MSSVAARSLSPHSPPFPPSPPIKRILAAFNTWAFKRAQPSDPTLLHAAVEHAASARRPVPFVLYWGKGPRETLAKPDEACLDYLASMVARIEAAYPAGATVELLLTDTHARLNRHSDRAIDSYFGDIAAAAGARGFSSRRLSAVVDACPDRPSAGAAAAVDPAVLDHLTHSAAKWYRGDGSARYGAIQYYAMNMSEKRAVEAAYPQAIFITFNNSDFRVLFPDRLAIFYMYSLRKGFAVKPWFIDA